MSHPTEAVLVESPLKSRHSLPVSRLHQLASPPLNPMHLNPARIRKEFYTESNVVAEVCNEGVVRIFCPLNVGGTFDFGSISINFLLWFCATFPEYIQF